jgi:hypothetical protein
MSLTSYRAAPPRDDGWRVGNGEWFLAGLSIRYSLFVVFVMERKNPFFAGLATTYSPMS